MSLPRTRGGLPQSKTAERRYGPFAPHTRGSTGGFIFFSVAKEVCPAHAGVYPKGSVGHEPSAGLPRTRGGLPSGSLGTSTNVVFAPHTRGSTVVFVPLPPSALVCPAHAGVYPLQQPCRRYDRCLPRTRGGLPSSGIPWSRS